MKAAIAQVSRILLVRDATIAKSIDAIQDMYLDENVTVA